MEFDIELTRRVYEHMKKTIPIIRERLGRPMTYAEKVLFSHLDDPEGQDLTRGRSELLLRPDRVAMQDATAQMAILQFMTAGRSSVAVPTTVHCDHLILARRGAEEDLASAQDINGEVYRFLRSAAQKYGMGFWGPGAGIIHQVVLEKYAFPGGMMIGTDSHTPNAGGMGMVAVGVGGADAVDVMVGMPWAVANPRLIGVYLKGKLSGWTSPKDVILKVAETLTVKGGTGKIVEYFGPGTASISATGKCTITNMGAEIGATTSIFPYDERQARYLAATEREAVVELAEEYIEFLRADSEVDKDPERYFDEIIEIDLDSLEPHLVGPHTPDLAHPVSRMGADARENGWPVEISAALIGSCTNSSYEDLSRAAHIVRQAVSAGMKTRIPLLVTPGSEQIHKTIARDGLLDLFKEAGAVVLANACGPCIGQWKRDDVPEGTPNSIVTSYNRNFKKRNDGNPATHSFIGSPEIVTAYAFAGTFDFNPLNDAVPKPDGGEFCFKPPEGPEIPERGFVIDETGFLPPDEKGASVEVVVDPGSERLALLEPFPKWRIPEDFENLSILVKAKGKCTTDHISQAGPWLRYRGHLDKISDNMFLGAVNAFTEEVGQSHGKPFPALARKWKASGRGWIVVGDENYGEGSSREHAAMEPRHLGCRAVIVKSFARIHETNLKKQGILPLWFKNPADYETFREDDVIAIRGLENLAPGSEVSVLVRHSDGSEETVLARHTLTESQVRWFFEGSALNAIRASDA
ncbi:MAG: aconitate hydratase [Candidatus Hydrogenedentota bacterium]|nr:MAG: aconitate hydratase [Candidatus Hydrogenedentota bacterium]